MVSEAESQNGHGFCLALSLGMLAFGTHALCGEEAQATLSSHMQVFQATAQVKETAHS